MFECLISSHGFFSCLIINLTRFIGWLQIALVLLRERSRLVVKLLESRERCAEHERTLKDERERSSTLEENVERHVAECEQLCTRLASAESLNRVL